MLCIGLMSGTSMDGVDAVLCRIGDRHLLDVRDRVSVHYPQSLRDTLLSLQRDVASVSLHRWAELDEQVADVFADAVLHLLGQTHTRASDVSILGSHGQTVFHDPLGARSSLQLGDPNRIAVRTGITTVADFRRKDIALGGQGAPLVPAFHRAVFGRAGEARVVLNLGGIANLTLLPTDAAPVRGFDTGPGNGLMDEWAQRHHGLPYDDGGHWASQGKVQPSLLDALLAEPYFDRAPPKSTGRGDFHLPWLERRFPDLNRLDPVDVQATLCELTARSVAQALRAHAANAKRILVCGGGVHNTHLMERLRALCGVPVESTALHGLEPQAVEGAAFAWLAYQTLHANPGNIPTVTGASREAILGGIYRP